MAEVPSRSLHSLTTPMIVVIKYKQLSAKKVTTRIELYWVLVYSTSTSASCTIPESAIIVMNNYQL